MGSGDLRRRYFFGGLGKGTVSCVDVMSAASCSDGVGSGWEMDEEMRGGDSGRERGKKRETEREGRIEKWREGEEAERGGGRKGELVHSKVR